MTESKPQFVWIQCRVLRQDASVPGHVIVSVRDGFYEGVEISIHRDLAIGNPPDSSPIPPERVPEALREIARLKRQILAISLAAGPSNYDEWPPEALLTKASRLDALAAKGGAR